MGTNPQLPTVRLALSGDLHAQKGRKGSLREAFSEVDRDADLLLLAGDLTDHGTVEEGELLVEELSKIRVPKIAVFGNHDYEANEDRALRETLDRGGIHVLDGSSFRFGTTLAVAGVKGFCGGFGAEALAPWGEQELKQFVALAIDEAGKLQRALEEIRDVRMRIVLLHYAPIRATTQGEKPELVPFLGSTRLAEPIDASGPTLVVHGHAHAGALEGRTSTGVRVLNVAMRLLINQTRRAYRIERL